MFLCCWELPEVTYRFFLWKEARIFSNANQTRLSIKRHISQVFLKVQYEYWPQSLEYPCYFFIMLNVLLMEAFLFGGIVWNTFCWSLLFHIFPHEKGSRSEFGTFAKWSLTCSPAIKNKKKILIKKKKKNGENILPTTEWNSHIC